MLPNHRKLSEWIRLIGLIGWMIVLSACLSTATAANSESPKPPIPQLDTGGHDSLIRDIVFTQDGRQLVSAGDDKLVRVWDIQTGQTVRTLRGETGPGLEGTIYALALSPDNRWLAVGGWMPSNEIRLYDFASGELVALLAGHTNVVHALAFSADNAWLVSGQGGSTHQTAIIWNLATRQPDHILRGHTDRIYAVSFTPDNQRVVTGSYDHSLKLWDRSSGALIQTMTGHTDKIQAVAVTPDNRILSGSLDQSIRIWNGTTGATLGTLVKDQGTQIGSLSVSPDGRHVLTGVGLGLGNDTHLYELASGKRIQRYSGHDNIVLATAFSSDGSLAATAGGNNRQIHLWSTKTGQLQHRLAGTGQAVWAVGFSPDNRYIAWGNTYDKQHINQRGPLTTQLRLPDAQHPLGQPQPINLQQDWQRAQSRSGDWSLQHQPGGAYNHKRPEGILAIQKMDQTVATIQRGSTSGYRHRAYTFAGQQIISGGGSGVLTLYDRTGQTLGEFRGHTGDIWVIAVSPDGRLLVSGAADQTIRVWHIATQALLISVFQGSDGEWVAWTPQGFYASSAEGDRLIGWQLNRGPAHAAEYVTAAALKKYFYRPDVLTDALRRGSAIAAAEAVPDIQLASLLDQPRPMLEGVQLAYERTANQPWLLIKIPNQPGRPIDDLQVFIDGRQMDASMTRSHHSEEYPTVVHIPLPSQDSQQVIVRADNQYGSAQIVRNIQIPKAVLAGSSINSRGKLFVLSIGAEYDLQKATYALNDARAFYRHIVGESDRFTGVASRMLVNGGSKPPNRANIQAALEWLQQATPDDTVVVFVAGHGILQGRDYYFLGTDTQTD